MNDFRISLFGRPNVGKSSLFNALLGFKRAIVYDISGTTVDEIEERPLWGKGLTLFDSQGVLDEGDREVLDRLLEGSDAFLLVVDAVAGCTPYDRWLAKEIQKTKKPVLLVINKAEARQAKIEEFVELGLEPVAKVSAAHRKNLDAIKNWCLKTTEEKAVPVQSVLPPDLTLCLIGRTNAGKSTLFNQLIGAGKAVVSDTEHTTRDALAWEVQTTKGKVKIFDTAGRRRRRMKSSHIEKLSVHQANKWLRQCDAVLILINASEELTEQDLKIIDVADQSGKPVAILLNFWDVIDQDQRRFLLRAMKVHPILQRFRYLPLSAKTGFNVKKCFDVGFELKSQSNKRVPTARLNKLLKEMVAKNPPPASGHKRFNLLYASQVDVAPPTFVFFMNRKGALPRSYEAYLENEIRDTFGLRGQPIRLQFRAKDRDPQPVRRRAARTKTRSTKPAKRSTKSAKRTKKRSTKSAKRTKKRSTKSAKRTKKRKPQR